MLNEISATTQTNLHAAPTPEQTPGATGKLIGKAVIEVQTPQSILQDAMEELSYNFNKSNDYALRCRKERDRTERSSKDRLKAFRKVAEDSGHLRVDELKKAIEEHPEREAIIRRALEQYEEADEAWACLEQVREELENSGAHPEVLKELDEALSLLDIRYGAAIRAGITGSLTAAENYVSLGAPLELGATYRKAVLEFTKTLDLYNYIQENYGGNFEQAVDFLYASLASDMRCDQPSVEISALKSLNTSFGRLRSFQSANAICDKQLSRWQNVHHVSNCPLQGIDLLGNILKMSEQSYLSPSNAHDLALEAKAPDLEHRIYFLQELLQNLRNFSPLVFDSNEGRTRLLDAVQAAVDQAVTEEDALLAKE
ncbi:MAG: TyeA family type III secretion system gatekeeper subunit [Desulfovibrio sp.]|nr:TyeA family type III secretion system gatekeeper subunit [Desulfovibrio sp.]